jgi:hypothetical protein
LVVAGDLSGQREQEPQTELGDRGVATILATRRDQSNASLGGCIGVDVGADAPGLG